MWLWVAVWFAAADQTATDRPIQSEKYQCHIDTVISSDGGLMVAQNM